MSGRLEKRFTVFCPSHDGYWAVERSATQIQCPMGTGHLLSGVPGGVDPWEYCTDCDTFWAIDLSSPKFVKDTCRRCSSRVALRFLCETCATLAFETEAASDDRRIRFEAGRGLTPHCPGCRRAPEGPLMLHECDEIVATFITSRSLCPFCDEPTQDVVVAGNTTTVDACPGCGQSLPAGSKFCGFCGHTLDTSSVVPEAMPAMGPRSVESDLMPRRLPSLDAAASAATAAAPIGAESAVASSPVSAPPADVHPAASPPFISPSASAESSRLVACPACRNATPADSKFCEHCAFPVQKAPAGESAVSRNQFSNSESLRIHNEQPAPPGKAPPELFQAGESEADRWKNAIAVFRLVPKPVLVAAGAGLVGLLLIVGVWSSTRPSFLTKIDSAIAENRIASPAKDCVSDIFDAELNRTGESAAIVEARKHIRAALEPKINELLDRRFKRTTDEDPIVWGQFEPEIGLLARLHPADKSLNAAYLFFRGMRRSDAGENDQALADLSKALELRPNWVLALNAIGNLYGRKKDWPRADEALMVDYYKKACSADNNFTWSYKNLGNYYLGKNDLGAAEFYLLEARRCYPSYPHTLTALGEVCRRRNRPSEAIAYFDQARKAFLDRGRGDDARKIDERIAELQR